MQPSPSSSVLAQSLRDPSWTASLTGRPRGVVLAREAHHVLAWDDHHWVSLFNDRGERQGQMRCAGGLTNACAADSGAAYAVLGQRGEVWWLAPDLSARWQRSVRQSAVAGCLDPHGQYLAVSDARGGVTLFDSNGRFLWQAQTPRPLHHLCFVPEQPLLIGCADAGLVIAFDFKGQPAWRDGLAAQVGSLSVTGSGDRVAVACFSEGVRSYNSTGQKLTNYLLPEPSRLLAMSYDGSVTLVAGMSQKVMLLDRDGKVIDSATVEQPIAGLTLGALGDDATLALTDGRVCRFTMPSITRD